MVRPLFRPNILDFSTLRVYLSQSLPLEATLTWRGLFEAYEGALLAECLGRAESSGGGGARWG